MPKKDLNKDLWQVGDSLILLENPARIWIVLEEQSPDLFPEMIKCLRFALQPNGKMEYSYGYLHLYTPSHWKEDLQFKVVRANKK